MARASRAVADQHRIAIEEASARLFRQHGLRGVSVAQVMADAGLTHGGFYGHFASKDDLVAVACARAFTDSSSRWQQLHAKTGGDAGAVRRKVVENYLSEAHRDSAGHSCPASALASDVAREPADKPVRGAFLDGLKQLLATWKTTAICDADADGDAEHATRGTDADRAALLEMSMLVGAVTLARATAGDALSDDILAAARAWLLDPAGQAALADLATASADATESPHS